jgi:hypothetical protein
MGFYLLSSSFVILFSSSTGQDDFQIPKQRQALKRCTPFIATPY